MDGGFFIACVEFTLIFWLVNAIIALLELQQVYKIIVVLLVLVLVILLAGYAGGDLSTSAPLFHLRHGVN